MTISQIVPLAQSTLKCLPLLANLIPQQRSRRYQQDNSEDQCENISAAAAAAAQLVVSIDVTCFILSSPGLRILFQGHSHSCAYFLLLCYQLLVWFVSLFVSLLSLGFLIFCSPSYPNTAH